MKRIISFILALASSGVFAATLYPIQLLSPAGSTSGQVIVSTGPSTPPGFSSSIGSITSTGLITTPNLQVNSAFSLGPTATSLALGMDTAQSMTGTTSANCTTTTLIMYPCANLFYVSSDNVAAASPTNAYDEWQFAANFGGSSLTGARQTVDIIGHFTAPSSASNTNKGYDALAAEMITNSGDGGTAPDTVNGKGSFFGTNPLVIANSGATNLFGIAGEEIDVGCNGCTTAIRFGLSAANFGTTQAAILANDAALHIGNIGGGGAAWHQALNLSNVNGGAPLDTTGCVICTDTTANTIGTGIDLSHYTISGNFLAGPSGFTVSGAGAVTAPGGIGTSGGLAVSSGGASIAGGLSVTGTVSGTGFSNYLASPPAIGGTAPAAGKFTTLTTTSMSRVKAGTTNAQSIPNNAFTAITTYTTTQNQGANFVASTGVYTAPVAGDYDVRAGLRFTSAAGVVGTQIIIAVFVNGVEVYQSGSVSQSTSTDSIGASGAWIVTCAANDLITIRAFQNSGLAMTLDGTAPPNFLNISQLP